MRTLMLAVLVVAGMSLHLSAQAAPYGIDRRPQPRGTILDTLLPQAIGSFRRAPFVRTPVPVNEILVVRYGSGVDSVAVGFRVPGKPEDAQAGVRQSRDEARDRKADLKRAEYVVKEDPSYFHTDRLMAWSRGGYFFSAAASSVEALDRFMRAFPY